MRALLHRNGRILTTALLMSGLAVASVAAPDAPLASRAEAAGSITTVYPGIDGAGFRAALMALEPGGTLLMAPGVYRTGLVVPTPATVAGPKVDAKGTVKKMSVGTATAPITVRAADPRNRPLILGELKLWGPSYWRLDGLRIQSVDSGKDALYIGGGKGWTVRNSEFFGARQTGAYSNVTLATDAYGTGAPSAFKFMGNCVHDAARTTRRGTDHNIYVSFRGNATSGGYITRNIIFNHANGVGIKLGDGGVPGAKGPWGVKVTYNTIAQGGRQVLLHGDVRNNIVARNILSTSTQPFSTVNKTTSVYLNLVIGGGNTFVNNYAAYSTMFYYGKTARIGADNAVRPNPHFSGAGCGGYRPTYVKAAAYGRYGAGLLPTW